MKTIDKRHQNASGARLMSSLLIASLLTGCSLFSYKEATPISTVVKAAEDGTSSAQIISEMRAAQTVYALRGSDFAKLAERGVPDPVLDDLQQRFFSKVEFFTFRWYSYGSMGGPPEIFPMPVDLDNLDQGGNGMGPTAGVGNINGATRPQGVPDWVPPYPDLSGQKISPNEVVKMTKSGMSTEEIVEKVKHSLVKVIYADNPQLVGLSRSPALTGSMYADFAKQGVAYEVLDALQAVYFAQHVEQTRYTAVRGTGGYW